jgi:paraquat-inducible protein B
MKEGCKMLKTILGLIVKVLESRLKKSGIEEEILKNKNYITEAGKIWDMVDENKRISKTIEDKIISKVDEFNNALIEKFPELTQKDIDNLRQSVAGSINKGKAAVLDNSEILRQMQADNARLQAENTAAKEQLKKVQSVVATDSIEATQTNNTLNSVQG